VTAGRDSDAIEQTRAAERGPARTFASGRYVVRQLLGEGGQKTVYLVHDTTLERDCALSLLKAEALDPDSLSRVRREAQVMASLDHPNIVTVHDFGEEEDPGGQRRPYIVCEYMSGGDLSQELRRAGGPVALERALAIAADIAEALAAAHERGIVHRDVKPANVWLSDPPAGSGRAGSAKLGDFGIAVALDRARLTMTATVTGTAAYMAPEQAQGEEVDARSDLYALGCLLYELATGRPPFLGADPQAVISQHIHAAPAAPSRHAEVPDALDTLILRLLAKAPAERPRSAAGVAEELRRIAGRSTQEAHPASPPQAEVRALRRLWANRASRVAAALLALGVIGGGSVGGVVLSGAIGGSGSPAGAEYRKLDIHTAGLQVTFQPVSGDCQSSDQILQGVYEGPGVVTGDFTGHSTYGDIEFILYLSDSCQWGFGKGTFTMTDQSGNTLSVAYQNSVSVAGGTSAEGPRATNPHGANIITGGTGAYEGARGHGRCSLLITSEPVTDSPGALRSLFEYDCTEQVTPGGVASADAEPVILELGAGATRMTVFASPVDLPKKAYFNVLYFNPRDQMQTGLALKLRAPEGAEIIAAERGEKEPAAGEHVWALPDLAPGALGRLEFSVTFLSAKNKTVDLVAEIAGDGFDHPSRSDPLAIEVVQ
jgi:hypothetical protein